MGGFLEEARDLVILDINTENNTMVIKHPYHCNIQNGLAVCIQLSMRSDSLSYETYHGLVGRHASLVFNNRPHDSRLKHNNGLA